MWCQWTFMLEVNIYRCNHCHGLNLRVNFWQQVTTCTSLPHFLRFFYVFFTHFLANLVTVAATVSSGERRQACALLRSTWCQPPLLITPEVVLALMWFERKTFHYQLNGYTCRHPIDQEGPLICDEAVGPEDWTGWVSQQAPFHCLCMSRIVWGISMRERKSQMHENSYYYYPEVFT